MLKLPNPATLSEPLNQAVLDGMAWTVENALPLAGTLCLVALASEILPRLFPLRDARAKYLAAGLGVDPGDVVPIGDGVQLWLDAGSRLKTDDPESSCPIGCPTLKASYVVHRNGQLLLVCVHSTEGVVLVENPDHDGLLDARVATLDHNTGNVHAADLPVEPETDAVLRTNLIEAIANTKFGYQGAVAPVILWKDPRGVAPEPEDERTLSGLKPSALFFNESGGVVGSLPTARGQFRRKQDFSRLARWLRRQPARATPASRIALRAGIVGLFGWALLIDPSFAGHDEAVALVASLRAALGL